MIHTEPSLPGPTILTRGARREAAASAAKYGNEATPIYIHAYATHVLATLAADALGAQGAGITAYYARRSAIATAIRLGRLGAFEIAGDDD